MTPRAEAIGRYALYGEIAAGGMATVCFGRLLGDAGFARIVAVKRLHPHVASDPEFSSMFVDEARLAARVQHPNVVPTLDVVAEARELLLVMEYVRGESLGALFAAARERKESVPLAVLVAIVAGALRGLHAAHEATREGGEPLGLVHRDVSPQNVLVGADGVARVLDFGVAKARGRMRTTRDGRVRGKLGYMAPEQLGGDEVTRRVDVYAAGVVLWEGLTGRRLYQAENESALVEQVLLGYVDPPGKYAPKTPEAVEAAAMRALERDPTKRFETAREMALALERAVTPAPPSEVGAWVARVAADALAARDARVAEIERAPSASAVVAARDARAGSAGGAAEDARGAWPSTRGALAAVLALVVAAVAARALGGRAAFVRARAAAPGSAAADARVAGEPAAADARGAPPDERAAVDDAVPVAPPTAAAIAAPAATTPPAAKPRAPAPSKDDCRVKFIVDATGRKLYKRQCL